MPGRRCPIACETWPSDPLFNVCPYCGDVTSYFHTATPSMTLDEAKSIKLHVLFEEFYEKHCAELGIPVDGPLPADFLVAS